MVSPYEVLQVDPDADEDEIDDAYRRRVKETHPDQGGSASEFRLVRLAYEEIQSGAYDRQPLTDAERGRNSPTPARGRRRRSGGPHRSEGRRRAEGPRQADGSRDGSRSRDAGHSRGAGRWRRTDDSRRDAGPPPQSSTVEYLDYEALADHGWSLDDADLFEKAADADLDAASHGEFAVEPDEYLLEAAEDCGYAWPYSCRGGACANCAVAVLEGDLEMAVDTVLPDELLERNIRLSCIGTPVSETTKVVYNVKQLPDLEELRLPPRPFAQAGGDE